MLRPRSAVSVGVRLLTESAGRPNSGDRTLTLGSLVVMGFQNESRNANCSRRGLEFVAVDVISPNVGDPRVVFGSAKFGVLVKLKASARNCSLMVSRMGRSLVIEKSRCLSGGP